MKVYLDSAEENIVPELALDAEYVLPGTWNGWAQPVATETCCRTCQPPIPHET